MTAYKPHDTHDPRQAAKSPVYLEAQLMPGTLQFEIHTMVESQMAMSTPDDAFKNHKRGRAAHSDPKILLKALLLAYCRGITSSSEIEAGCRDNIAFMALTGGYVPGRRAIAAFVFSMRDNLRLILRDVLLACDQGLLEGTPFALDESPPSTPEEGRNVAQALERRRQELEAKVAQLITKHLEADTKEAETSRKQSLSETSDRGKRPARWQSLKNTPNKKG